MKCINLYMVFLLGITMSYRTYAETGKAVIDFQGTLRASPCIIENDTLTFDFGDISFDDFPISGPWKSGSIKFIDCPPSTSKIKATFKGEPSEDLPEYGYKNAGSAKNVSVQLDRSGENIGMGNGRSCDIEIKNNKAELRLSTRLKKAEGATPGSIKAQVQVEFTYN